MKAMDGPATAARVRFGAFELDRRSGELLKGNTRLRLQEGPLRVLQALLDRSGEVVTREELYRRLWPDGTFVDFDNGLNSAVNRLRAALGDQADRPQYVETVGRRGYRFIGAVSSAAAIAVPERDASRVTIPRLAILPFRQLLPDAETEFLCFSLADAIASSLSGLESLTVQSPIAAARFASEAPDLAAISTSLGASLVLAGTVMRAGDRVRVTAQLIDAPGGTLRWTTTAEATIDDLFRVLDGLVRRIVESLALPLTTAETRSLEHDVPGNGSAFELYLRANRLGRYPGTWPQARDLYLASIRMDPGYAPAWARLGRTYRMMAKYATDVDPQIVRLAEESFRRALALNPELSLTHYLYAQLEMETGRAIEACVRLLDRAHERRADPQLFAGLVQACRYVGLLDASHAAHRRARRLDPAIKTSIAYTSAIVGDYARAAIDARENGDPFEGVALALADRPTEAIPLLTAVRDEYGSNRIWTLYADFMLALAQHDRDRLAQIADECLRVPFADPDGLFYVGVGLGKAGDVARARIALQRTVDAGFCCPAALHDNAALCALHGDAVFEALAAETTRRHADAIKAFDAAGGPALLRDAAGVR